ncbi:hypothetical protein AAVH_13353 [Aphelenchoides avenae]|nr:hypothetical protein AAVH_13353 [Aphelenchus avenae]
MPCWYRELDTAYIYLYKPGRRPSRPFSDNITLIGPSGLPEGVSFALGADVCFHRQLAVAVEGTVMCTSSKPMASAHMELLVQRKNGPGWHVTEVLDGLSQLMTEKDGSYRKTISPGSVKDRDEIKGLVIWFANTCGHMANASGRPTAHIPLDYMYAYEQGYEYKAFVYNDQLDQKAHGTGPRSGACFRG